jgi:hypothetical protein
MSICVAVPGISTGEVDESYRHAVGAHLEEMGSDRHYGQLLASHRIVGILTQKRSNSPIQDGGYQLGWFRTLQFT